MNTSEISSVSIYPPIGISRIENSKEYLFSPDISGVEIAPKVPSEEHKNYVQVSFNGFVIQTKTSSIN